MRLYYIAGLVAVGLAVAIIIGCQSGQEIPTDDTAGYANPGDSSQTTGTQDGFFSESFDFADGFFAPDSHDLDIKDDAASNGTAEEDEPETEETSSHFEGIQIDPVLESSAGPKFVKTFDIDNDGLPDLISGWNESEPVQIHLQREGTQNNVYYETVTLGGTYPIAIIGDLDMADFNGDGWLDAAILIKETGQVGVCPKPDEEGGFEAIGGAGMGEIQILFSPGDAEQIADGDAWQEVRFARSLRPIRRDVGEDDGRTFPEYNGYCAMGVGEIDGINGPDIVVTYNPPVCEFYGDEPDPINRILLYANPGGANMFESGQIPLSVTAVVAPIDPVDGSGEQVTLDARASFTRQGLDSLGPYFSVPSTYAWTQTAGDPVTLDSSSSAAPKFTTATSPDALCFRVDVYEGTRSDFDYVTVLVGDPANNPPSVTASAEQTVVPDAHSTGRITVQMSAYATDPEADSLTYAWTQVAGTAVTLSGATTATPTFPAPDDGSELRFRVSVNDGDLTATDLVIINSGFWAPVRLREDLPRAGDLELSDVDLDGDLDVIHTYPDAMSANLSWLRNPYDVVGPLETMVPSNWQLRPVGHVNTYAEVFIIGDIDGDGYDDVLVRSSEGGVVQWFRHPGAADLEPIFPPPDVVPDRYNFPWQVYTISEFTIGRVAGMAIGDLTGDGFSEVAVSAGGVIYWFDGTEGESIYAQWTPNFVLDDTKDSGTTDDPTDPDYKDDGTVIFDLLIMDVDDDGYNDVIATFDRRVDSGLTNDTLIWFRNTLGDELTARSANGDEQDTTAARELDLQAVRELIQSGQTTELNNRNR